METIKEKTPRTRGPTVSTTPEAPIPDNIKLPDGRLIPMLSLVRKQYNTKFHNLITKREKSVNKDNTKFYSLPERPVKVNPYGSRVNDVGDGRKSKYSLQERMWQRTATTDQLCQRYDMTRATARATRKYALDMFTETETGLIINHKKLKK
jgi:hypothetical protein